MQKRIFLAILALIVVGVLSWNINKYFNTKTSDSGQKQEEKTSDQADTQTNASIEVKDKVIFIKTGQKLELKTVQNAKEESVSSLDLMVQEYAGFTQNKEAVFLVGDDQTSGKLVAINTQTGKEETLVESFAKPNALAISPDGKTLAYVFFSNVEADYGYNINVMSRDGSNKRKVFSSEDEIKNLMWLGDGALVFSQSKK